MRSPVDRLPSLLDYIERTAGSAPLRQAATDGRTSIDYRALVALIDEVAAALVARGVVPGHRIAFLGPPGLQFWVSLLATLRAGCVWVGLNPQQAEREMAHVLEDARPSLTLVAASIVESVRVAVNRAAAHAGVAPPLDLPPDVGDIASRLSQAPLAARSEDDTSAAMVASGVCLIVYTSGSSGRPKGALIPAGGLVENGWWLAKRLDFASVRALVNLPVNHIGCVGDVCATTVVTGGTVVFMERFDAAAIVELIRAESITWLAQVPSQFQLLAARTELAEGVLAGVRHLTWGGAAMPRSLIRQFQAILPDVFNSYGLTECSGTITVSGRGASLDVLADTVGHPVDPALLRIADERNARLPPGELGEVQIRGRHVFRGYLNQPEATAAAFTPDGWLKTGDLGVLASDGNLRLVGRTHDMFKSGGYNVYPREVETVIEALHGVELCAVLAVPDELWGEVGVAFVQADPDRVTVDRLIEHCSVQLARYKIPKRFVVQSALPLLAVGKIDKQELRARERTLLDAAGRDVPQL